MEENRLHGRIILEQLRSFLAAYEKPHLSPGVLEGVLEVSDPAIWLFKPGETSESILILPDPQPVGKYNLSLRDIIISKKFLTEPNTENLRIVDLRSKEEIDLAIKILKKTEGRNNIPLKHNLVDLSNFHANIAPSFQIKYYNFTFKPWGKSDEFNRQYNSGPIIALEVMYDQEEDITVTTLTATSVILSNLGNKKTPLIVKVFFTIETIDPTHRFGPPGVYQITEAYIIQTCLKIHGFTEPYSQYYE